MSFNNSGHQRVPCAVDHLSTRDGKIFGRDLRDRIARDNDVDIFHQRLVDAVEHIDVGEQNGAILRESSPR